MFCKDPSLTLLAKYGYNVVRLPRTGIEPLDVIGSDRAGVEALGRLPTIWDTPAKVPAVEDGNVAGEIKTVTTAELKLSVGLRVLEDILSGLGASVPRVDFAYTGQRSLKFTFGNIRIAKVEPFAVGEYLKAGDLHTANPWVGRYFLDDDADALVLTEVLKSDAVSVTADSSGGTTAGVDVKAIQNVVGGEVKVGVSGSNQSEVTYTGPRHLTFGFKAYRLVYDSGRWGVAAVDPSKGDTFLSPGDEGAAPVLLAHEGGRFGRVTLRSRG